MLILGSILWQFFGLYYVQIDDGKIQLVQSTFDVIYVKINGLMVYWFIGSFHFYNCKYKEKINNNL